MYHVLLPNDPYHSVHLIRNAYTFISNGAVLIELLTNYYASRASPAIKINLRALCKFRKLL